MIVATAGHIDHGKTSLVKALTGVETDRLPEEKARGLTIDLGFAYAAVDEGLTLGFVDVPGHERFIRNMLAGVSGIDLALLVVAADDGPMPQSEEHLAILDLLGVKAGAIALTKIDRVDDRRLADAREEIEALVFGTVLQDAPVFPVSSLSGNGVEALREHLVAFARTRRRREAAGGFRLAVDRTFTVSGAGLVVTGTVHAGQVAVGDRLLVSPRGTAVRVRGLHVQNRESAEGAAGTRCALNLVGPDLSRDTVTRGDWVVAPFLHAPTKRLDARVRLLEVEARPLKHWTPVHVHLGAAGVTGRIALLEDRILQPGANALAQIVLDHPIGALWGDRFVLRDQSAQRTIAGGSVIDPFAPARGRGHPTRLAVLAASEAEAPAEALPRLLAATANGIDLRRFQLARNLTDTEAEKLWQSSGLVRVGRPDAPFGLSPERWQVLLQQVVDALKDWHLRRPESPGLEEDRLRRTLDPRPRPDLLSTAVLELIRDGRVGRDGSQLALPNHRPTFSREDEAIWGRISGALAESGLRPPRVRELATDLDMDLRSLERFLQRLARAGLVARVADNRYFVPSTLRALADRAAELAGTAEDGIFTAAAYKDLTGIGRNLAIQVLEHFDRTGLTRRVGDGRRIAKAPAEVFGKTDDP